MLQDLFDLLKVGWEPLNTATKDWISFFENKYSNAKPTDTDARAVKESIAIMKYLLSGVDQQLRQANPTTYADVRDLTVKVQTYLDVTDSIHQDLTQRSSGDANAVALAGTVESARKVMSEQVKA